MSRTASILLSSLMIAAPASASYVVRYRPASRDDGRASPIAPDRPFAVHAGVGVDLPLAPGPADPGVRWSVVGLPDGYVASEGRVTGRSDFVGAAPVTVRGTDAAGRLTSVETQWVVLPPLSVSLSVPLFRLDRPVSVAFATLAGGPVRPWRFAVAEGRLPGGLRLDPASGTLSGTPRELGVTEVSIRVSDGVGGAAVSDVVTLVVGSDGGSGGEMSGPGFLIEAASDVPTRVGAVVSTAPPRLGGAYAAPITWSLVDPIAGLDVDPQGRLTGSILEPGTFTTELKAVDAAGSTAYSSTISIAVRPSLRIEDPASLRFARGQAVAMRPLRVLNGPEGRLIWSAGGLPDGLSLMPDGSIRGAPAAAGSHIATVVATDESGFDAVASLVVTVDP